jgi:hypothetical protein
MKKSLHLSIPAASALALAIAFIMPAAAFAVPTPTFTATQSIRNDAALNDQTHVLTTPTPNVAEVKATRTLNFNTGPVASTTITVGTCVITFATTTAGVGTAENTNCTGGTAVVRTATGGTDVARTPAQLATALRTITNLVGVNHGPLTVTAGTSTTATVFTTTGTESSATPITFVDGTSGSVTSLSSTSGTIPVAQVSVTTVGGTLETGDTYSVTFPGAAGTVSYTVLSSDTTGNDIATGINAAVHATSTYAAQTFTSAASSNTVVFTAKTPGTGFTISSSASNGTAIAQQVVFTPSNVLVSGFGFTATINGVDHTYNDGVDVPTVTAGLNTQLAGNGAATCTNGATVVTCTAVTPGTSFTYGATVLALAHTTTFHSGSGGGSSGYKAPLTGTMSLTDQIAALKVKIAGLTAGKTGTVSGVPSMGSASFTRSLTVGSKGDDVRALQMYLNTHGFAVAANGAGSTGFETSTFGPGTKAALMKFQMAKGITPASGFLGLKTRAALSAGN